MQVLRTGALRGRPEARWPTRRLQDPTTNVRLAVEYLSGLRSRWPDPGAYLSRFNGRAPRPSSYSRRVLDRLRAAWKRADGG